MPWTRGALNTASSNAGDALPPVLTTTGTLPSPVTGSDGTSTSRRVGDAESTLPPCRSRT